MLSASCCQARSSGWMVICGPSPPAPVPSPAVCAGFGGGRGAPVLTWDVFSSVCEIVAASWLPAAPPLEAPPPDAPPAGVSAGAACSNGIAVCVQGWALTCKGCPPAPARTLRPVPGWVNRSIRPSGSCSTRESPYSSASCGCCGLPGAPEPSSAKFVSTTAPRMPATPTGVVSFTSPVFEAAPPMKRKTPREVRAASSAVPASGS